MNTYKKKNKSKKKNKRKNKTNKIYTKKGGAQDFAAQLAAVPAE